MGKIVKEILTGIGSVLPEVPPRPSFRRVRKNGFRLDAARLRGDARQLSRDLNKIRENCPK